MIPGQEQLHFELICGPPQHIFTRLVEHMSKWHHQARNDFLISIFNMFNVCKQANKLKQKSGLEGGLDWKDANCYKVVMVSLCTDVWRKSEKKMGGKTLLPGLIRICAIRPALHLWEMIELRLVKILFLWITTNKTSNFAKLLKFIPGELCQNNSSASVLCATCREKVYEG